MGLQPQPPQLQQQQLLLQLLPHLLQLQPPLPQQPQPQLQLLPQLQSTPILLVQDVRHQLVLLLVANVSFPSHSRESATMDVLSGFMEESSMARHGAALWWILMESMWMELETGEFVLTPVNNIAILDSYN